MSSHDQANHRRSYRSSHLKPTDLSHDKYEAHLLGTQEARDCAQRMETSVGLPLVGEQPHQDTYRLVLVACQLVARVEGDGITTDCDGHLRTVNQLATDIARLNSEITTIEAGRSTANDLRDTRELKIKQIAELMDVQVMNRSNGSVDVLVAGQMLVTGHTASQLSASQTTTGTTDIHVGVSKLSVSPQVKAGTIGGLLRHEQEEIPALLAKLDRIARNMALEFNRIHSTGIPAP